MSSKRRRRRVAQQQRRQAGRVLRRRLIRGEPGGDPPPFPSFERLLERNFPELERATVEQQAEWSRIFIDESRPFAERMAASERLAESLGMFDGAGPNDE